MKLVLKSMFFTNMFFLILVILLTVASNSKKKNYFEYKYLTDKVIDRFLDRSVVQELLSKNIGKSREAMNCLGKKNLFGQSRIIYFLNNLIDIEILKFLGVKEDEIKLILKELKPFIRISKYMYDIKAIYFYGSMTHIVLTLFYIIFLLV